MAAQLTGSSDDQPLRLEMLCSWLMALIPSSAGGSSTPTACLGSGEDLSQHRQTLQLTSLIGMDTHSVSVLLSCIRRILQLLARATAEPHLACDVQALLRSRITQAVALRAALGLPSPKTSVYRLVNRYLCASYMFWTC